MVNTPASNNRFALALALVIAACGASLAHAADPVRDFPLRPVRFVSPFPAGGSSDLVGRMIAPKMSERLDQNVIFENRSGAGGMIGANYVAKATPDGHTLLFLSGAFTAQAASIKTLPFDPLRDFAWVSMVITYPFAIVVKAESPVQTVPQLIAAAKKNPGKLNFGSVGIGSVFHLAGELFNTMAVTEMVHVPYKGGAEPVTELIGGRIDVIFNTLTGVYQQIQSNRLRAIAVASLERSPQLPGVPTVAETLPGYEVISFNGLAAPRGTPPSIVMRLSREIRTVLEQPDMNKRLVDLGGTLHPTTPEEMRRYVEAEISKWKRIVEARKIQVE
jgi:tripartite-type tricarboxylate transporter receptor subunit TctC